MRNKIVACFVLIFGASLLWAQSGEPSLAEVAKHKPKKHAAKVVTEDDIPPSVSFDSAGSSADTNAKSGEDEAEGGDQAKQGDDQAKDSQSQPATQSASASDDAARLQQLKDQEARQKQIMQEIKQQMEGETSEFRRNIRRQMVDDMQVKLDKTAKEREQIEQRMAGKKRGQTSSEPTNDDNPK